MIFQVISSNFSEGILGEKLQGAITQLQHGLTFSNLNVMKKQSYTWTHIVKSNVCVGLLCDDTPP